MAATYYAVTPFTRVRPKVVTHPDPEELAQNILAILAVYWTPAGGGSP